MKKTTRREALPLVAVPICASILAPTMALAADRVTLNKFGGYDGGDPRQPVRRKAAEWVVS